MATKQQAKVETKAIKELIQVTLRTREDSKRAKELREQAKQEAIALYKAKNWEIGKDLPFDDVKIRLYYEKVYIWEKNHQIKDTLLECYCAQLQHIEWLKQQVKKTEAELKMTSDNLERAYPDSESIKYEMRFQIR